MGPSRTLIRDHLEGKKGKKATVYFRHRCDGKHVSSDAAKAMEFVTNVVKKIGECVERLSDFASGLVKAVEILNSALLRGDMVRLLSVSPF